MRKDNLTYRERMALDVLERALRALNGCKFPSFYDNKRAALLRALRYKTIKPKKRTNP